MNLDVVDYKGKDDDTFATKILKDYGYSLIQKSIGEGSFARVKKVKFEAKGEKMQFACKILNRYRQKRNLADKMFPRELEMIIMVDHPNIVKTQAIFEIGHKIYIMMELAAGGDLLNYARETGAMCVESHMWKCKKLFYGTMCALEYLHNMDVAHRDIKLDNILLDNKKDLNAKISDFGFARYTTEITTGDQLESLSFCGSMSYMPPEVIRGEPYKPRKMDIWSAGVVLYCMLFSQMPFDDHSLNPQLMLRDIYAKMPMIVPNRFANYVGAEVANLLKAMLNTVPEKRATAQHVLRSRFLSVFRESRSFFAPTQPASGLKPAQ